MLALLGYASYRSVSRTSAPPAAGVAGQEMRITRLTSAGNAHFAAISPDGKYVAHAVAEGGKQSLWVRHVATSSNVQIVPPAEVEYRGMTFSPDGGFIYFIYGENSNPGVLAALPGSRTWGTPRKLITDVDTPPTFSPDGRQFAFVRGYPQSGESALLVANADGTGERKLAVRKFPRYYRLFRPAWSPDGTMIAVDAASFASQRQTVVAVSVADGSEKPLTSHEWAGTSRLSWLPDGTALVVQAGDATLRDRSQLFLVAYPGGEVRRITNDLNSYRDATLGADSKSLVTVQSELRTALWTAPQGDAGRARQLSSGTGNYDGFNGLAWTPDGRIVYSSSASGNPDLWIMDADGTKPRQLTTNPAVDIAPVVSPDGRTVLFTSNRTGSFNLWRMDSDGGNSQQLTKGNAYFAMDIAPDGKWMLYASYQSGQPALWRVPLEGGQPAMLSKVESFGRISPDGKLVVADFFDEKALRRRFAIVSSEGGEPLHVLDIPGADLNLISWSHNGKSLEYSETKDGVGNLWQQPLDGGKPRQLTHFTSEEIFNYAWSRDGKHLAVTRGTQKSDVVLITDFR